MLKEAYNLLKEQYAACFEIVHEDEFYRKFAEEKWRHSMQVAGAGNYLVRHIDWLKTKPETYQELVRTAILLHDVCRFTEIVHLFYGKKGYDHGVAGSELLKNMPRFMDIRIWLPIKHHGHMIEDLYADEEYLSISDKTLQKEVEKICFIVRDADKIANLHMLVNEKNIRFLFLKQSDETPGADEEITDTLKAEALQGIIVSRKHRLNCASSTVTYLSWYTDINYRAAIDFCARLNVTEMMLTMFKEYCKDEVFTKQYTEVIRRVLRERNYLD